MADERRGQSEDKIDAPKPGEEPRKAKGQALPRGEEDFNRLSQVQPVDIRDARADWKKRTLPGMGGLIEATLEEGE
jgi:hypothetical protein